MKLEISDDVVWDIVRGDAVVDLTETGKKEILRIISDNPEFQKRVQETCFSNNHFIEHLYHILANEYGLDSLTSMPEDICQEQGG